MKIQNFTPTRPTPARPPQVRTQLDPGDAYIPPNPNPVSTIAATTVLGAGLGLYAGAAKGMLPGVAGLLVGAGGGTVVGGLVGGAVERVIDPGNSWSGFRGMTVGGPIGGALGAVGGALAGSMRSGAGTALVMGLSGAAGGALVGYLISQNQQ